MNETSFKYPDVRLTVLYRTKSSGDGRYVHEFDFRRGGFLGLFADHLTKAMRFDPSNETGLALALLDVGVPMTERQFEIARVLAQHIKNVETGI